MRGTALSLHRLYARRACGPCSSIAVKVELQVSYRVSTLVLVPGSTFSVLLHADFFALVFVLYTGGNK